MPARRPPANGSVASRKRRATPEDVAIGHKLRALGWTKACRRAISRARLA